MQQKSLYLRFLGFITKKGNKRGAKNILDEAFFLASKRTKIPAHIVLLTSFAKLNSFVEVRKVKIKHNSHLVPFSISLKRRLYLITKWIMLATLEDKRKISIALKLASELTSIIVGSNSKALRLKHTNNEQAYLNRSNMHYRW